jgi:hypothetical protein
MIDNPSSAFDQPAGTPLSQSSDSRRHRFPPIGTHPLFT